MVNCNRQISGNTILTWNDVNNIREMNDTGKYSYEILSEKFNVSKGEIASIIRNEDVNFKRIYSGAAKGNTSSHDHRLTKEQED